MSLVTGSIENIDILPDELLGGMSRDGMHKWVKPCSFSTTNRAGITGWAVGKGTLLMGIYEGSMSEAERRFDQL